jgi:predicted PurR-regulated permease PerM
MPAITPEPSTPRPASRPLDRISPIFLQATLVALFLASLVLIALGLREAQVILAPITLGIVFGLMLGPLSDVLERRGISPGISAAVIVLGVIALFVALAYMFSAPVSEWLGLMPLIWDKMRAVLADLRQPLQDLNALRDQFQSAMGETQTMKVEVEGGHPLESVATLAPALLAQLVLFMVSGYFFLATRRLTRNSVLAVLPGRRLRWRMAHMFNDVETRISRFMIAVGAINLVFGLVVGVLMWILGMPSPVLWGILAGTLNFIPYVGQVFMVGLVFIVSMATFDGWFAVLLPAALYSLINFTESQFVTPHFLGRTLTLNPFLVFASLTFWIWAWGPVGGLVAIPFMLIMQSVALHALSPPSRLRTLSVFEKRRILERAALQSRLATAERG